MIATLESLPSALPQPPSRIEELQQTVSASRLGLWQACRLKFYFKYVLRLVKFIEQFKQMNFASDTEMEQQLETVRRELLSRTAEEYRDSTVARNRLVAGLSQLRETASRMAREDATKLVQRFGELGRRRGSTWRHKPGCAASPRDYAPCE